MKIGTIAEIWRYPVYFMGGERRPEIHVGRMGVPGDRGWAVYDEERQGVTTAKRLPALRGCSARYPTEPVEGEAPPPAQVQLPDGSMLWTHGDDFAPRMTALFGRPVSARSLGPAGSVSTPRVKGSGDPADARTVLGLEPGEPMPDMRAFPPEVLKALRHGNFFDAFPLLMLTSATLATLRGHLADGDWDVRRFRPNVFVEMNGTTDYPELDWIGRRLRIGGAVVEPVVGCPRCVMVTQPVDELPPDPRVMRTLVREAHHTAGVYARVVTGGAIRLGDDVEL
jgi:uncharacterized protein YcbX